MRHPAQLLTRMKGATPAGLCLVAILACMPIFGWHWLSFHALLQQPELDQVARPAVLAGLNHVLLAALLINVVLLLWLWPRRHRPDPLPRVAILIAMVQGLGYVAMGIAFGPITAPVNTVLISALVIGLSLLGPRPTMTGFVVAIAVLLINDWLVLAGVVPYAPALVPGSFQDGAPVAWWRHWQDIMFFTALVLGLGLMVWLFNRLDCQREQLEALSRTDSLTGLSNRHHFMERLALEQHRRDRYGLPFAVVLCDADHFKQVNDRFGHQAGDEVLRHIGALLKTGLRIPGDVAARLGGEEFALLLTACRESEARGVCERLREQLAAHEFDSGGRRFHVTLSLGAVECRHGRHDEILKAADRNLYRAKHAGRNRVVVSVQELPA